MASFLDRVIGAAKLDSETYEEVKRDTGATGQASLVVVLWGLGAGLGFFRVLGVLALGIETVMALIAWCIGALVIWFVGTKMWPAPATRADMGQLLRTMGFAAAPGVLLVLGAVPVLGRWLRLAVYFWMLVAMVVAVRQALDYDSTVRALAVCLIAVAIGLVLQYVLGVFLLAFAVGLAGGT